MRNTDTAGRRVVKLLDEGLPRGIIGTANVSGRSSRRSSASCWTRLEVLKELRAAELA